MITLDITTSIASVIAFIGAITALIQVIKGNNTTHEKLEEIHVLVNSRLDQALEEIKDLKDQRDKAQ